CVQDIGATRIPYEGDDQTRQRPRVGRQNRLGLGGAIRRGEGELQEGPFGGRDVGQERGSLVDPGFDVVGPVQQQWDVLRVVVGRRVRQTGAHEVGVPREDR